VVENTIYYGLSCKYTKIERKGKEEEEEESPKTPYMILSRRIAPGEMLT